MDKNLEKLSSMAKGENMINMSTDLNPLKKETVNHPAHYNRENAIECIEEMELIFGIEAVMNFCLLNVWKYRYRADSKNGDEDISKSDWYLAKYKELKEKKTSSTITTTSFWRNRNNYVTVPCTNPSTTYDTQYINNEYNPDDNEVKC